MDNFYRTQFNDDQGLQLTHSQCINIVEVYRPIDSDFRIQSLQDRRKKGFYRYSDENKHSVLITLDLLFELISKQINRNTFQEIKVSCNSEVVSFNKSENLYNNYLVGYKQSNVGEKVLCITRFNQLPENIKFCYRNIMA